MNLKIWLIVACCLSLPKCQRRQQLLFNVKVTDDAGQNLAKILVLLDDEKQGLTNPQGELIVNALVKRKDSYKIIARETDESYYSLEDALTFNGSDDLGQPRSVNLTIYRVPKSKPAAEEKSPEAPVVQESEVTSDGEEKLAIKDDSQQKVITSPQPSPATEERHVHTIIFYDQLRPLEGIRVKSWVGRDLADICTSTKLGRCVFDPSAHLVGASLIAERTGFGLKVVTWDATKKITEVDFRSGHDHVVKKALLQHQGLSWGDLNIDDSTAELTPLTAEQFSKEGNSSATLFRDLQFEVMADRRFALALGIKASEEMRRISIDLQGIEERRRGKISEAILGHQFPAPWEISTDQEAMNLPQLKLSMTPSLSGWMLSAHLETGNEKSTLKNFQQWIFGESDRRGIDQILSQVDTFLTESEEKVFGSPLDLSGKFNSFQISTLKVVSDKNSTKFEKAFLGRVNVSHGNLEWLERRPDGVEKRILFARPAVAIGGRRG